MAFDKTEIIVQTLQRQIESLKSRARSISKEMSEYEGASTICGQLAKTTLGFDDLIERRLSEDDDVNEQDAQKIRVYTKNLIVRLHTLCENNRVGQRNQVFMAQGRLSETQKQVTSLENEIQKHVNFAKQREEKEINSALEETFNDSETKVVPEPDTVSLKKPISNIAPPGFIDKKEPTQKEKSVAAEKQIVEVEAILPSAPEIPKPDIQAKKPGRPNRRDLSRTRKR